MLFLQAIERDKLRELHGQNQSNANPTGTNDFDYEDKLKTEESTMVYEGLYFNLDAENSKKKHDYNVNSHNICCRLVAPCDLFNFFLFKVLTTLWNAPWMSGQPS